VTSEHAVQVGGLPDLHRDPFDRLLVAQVQCEGITLVTTNATVARYPGPIRKI
jgi:PIN domain nuclease of toxin-antitoxin system